MSTDDSRKPQKPSGRVALDKQGNSTWEWLTDTGRFTCDIDTQRLKSLVADLSCDGGSAPDAVPLHDPYNRPALPSPGRPRAKRRTLDDLRRLSEEIKAAREKKSHGE